MTQVKKEINEVQIVSVSEIAKILLPFDTEVKERIIRTVTILYDLDI